MFLNSYKFFFINNSIQNNSLFVTVVTLCVICAYFDGFQIVAVSLIAEFSFRFAVSFLT